MGDGIFLAPWLVHVPPNPSKSLAMNYSKVSSGKWHGFVQTCSLVLHTSSFSTISSKFSQNRFRGTFALGWRIKREGVNWTKGAILDSRNFLGVSSSLCRFELILKAHFWFSRRFTWNHALVLSKLQFHVTCFKCRSVHFMNHTTHKVYLHVTNKHACFYLLPFSRRKSHKTLELESFWSFTMRVFQRFSKITDGI